MSAVEIHCDVAIVGSGPGGYVAALRCAQAGLDTVIIDRGPWGGTCLNVGCIPSKAIIHAAERFAGAANADELSHLGIAGSTPTIDFAATSAWKDGIVARLTGGVDQLLRSAGATQLRGTATIVDGKTIQVDTAEGITTVVTRNLVIATGSEPVEIPHLPFGGFGGAVLSSTTVLALTELPRTLVVVGAGYIGLELGTAFRKLGVQVTVVEMADSILPHYDRVLTAPVSKRLAAIGMTVLLDTTASGYDHAARQLTVTAADGASSAIEADRVLVTVGRRPLSTGFGIDSLELTMNGSAIAIDDRCRTSMTGVFAIGDVTGEPMLAHRATAQGELVAEVLAGTLRRWDKQVIPEVCFTDPEIVSVGYSPDQAEADGIDTVVGTFQFAANGRAMSLDRTDGLARVVARSDNHLVLGVQVVGAAVSELAAGLALAIEMGATLEDLTETVHPHPTLSEAIAEAALQAAGHPLHGPKARSIRRPIPD
ncbi:MAG: dihydrolipoyl dehydrogenase [Ilumatobacteraceae bacterium]